MRDDREIESDSDCNSDHDNMPPLENYEDNLATPLQGDAYLFEELLIYKLKKRTIVKEKTSYTLDVLLTGRYGV